MFRGELAVRRDAVRRLGLDESVRGNPMGDVQRRDVGVSGGALFIPGPVDKNHNSLHGTASAAAVVKNALYIIVRLVCGALVTAGPDVIRRSGP